MSAATEKVERGVMQQRSVLAVLGERVDGPAESNRYEVHP